MPEERSAVGTLAPAPRRSSLVTRADQASALLAQLTVVRDEQKYRDRYAQVEADLADAAKKLAPWPAILTAYRDRAAQIVIDAATVTRLQRALREIVAAYERSPASILDISTTARDSFWGPVRQLPETLQTARIASWSRFCTETLGAIPEQRLTILARVPTLGKRVAALRGQYAEAGRLRNTPGNSIQDFDRFAMLARQIAAALTALGTDFTDELLAFITEATSPAGADMRKLTDAIREGLKRVGLENLLRVRLDAPPEGRNW